jgi:hypothetical protein
VALPIERDGLRRPRLSLVRSADNHSATRPNATGAIGPAGATHRVSVVVGSVVVVGRFSDDRRSVRADTTGPIYAIRAYHGVGLMGRRKPAKHNDDGDCELSHGYLTCLRQPDCALESNPELCIFGKKHRGHRSAVAKAQPFDDGFAVEIEGNDKL